MANSGLLILLSAAVLFTGTTYSLTCPSSADACVRKSDLDALDKFQGDPSYYCEQGAKLVAVSQNLLKSCNFAEQNTLLQGYKNKINAFCFNADSTCPNVTDTYVAQTRCYDPYGGLDAVIKNIIVAFEAGQKDLQAVCNPIYWGRYCQRTQTCQINKNLDPSLITDNRIVGLGLAMCGSETIKDITQYLEQSEKCTLTIDSDIQSKCNISCGLANAGDENVKDEAELCRLLQTQAACLQEMTAGCSDAERKYVKPRLNSYAIANSYFSKCHIKYNGITVKPTGPPVDYRNVINACMLTGLLENFDIFDRIPALLNFDTVVIPFCNTLDDQDTKIADCRNAFLAVATPQSKLLTRSEDDLKSINIDFVPKLGTFPLDSYGMAYIYNWLPAVCPPKLQWSERNCVSENARNREEERGTTTTTGPNTASTTKNNVTPTRITPSKSRGDSTNNDVVSIGPGGNTRNPNSAGDKEQEIGSGGKEPQISSAGTSAMLSAVLLICSVILSVINM